MASVVFSADFEDKGQLKLLHMAVTQCIKEGWTGLEEEVARLRENGVRIGDMLLTPPGYSKHEVSFAFQCWNTDSENPPWSAGNDLRRVANALFNRPACKNLRAVGLD